MGADPFKSSTSNINIDLIDRARSDRLLKERYDVEVTALIENNRNLLDKIPELRDFHAKALEKAKNEGAMTPDGFGPDIVANRAQIDEAARIYKEYRKAGGDLSKMNEYDRSVTEIIQGLKSHEDEGVAKKAKLGWSGKDIFTHIDEDMPRIKPWHEERERLFAAQMKALDPYAKDLFTTGYNGDKNSKLLPHHGPEEVILYSVRLNAIKQYQEIFQSMIPWNEAKAPYGTREESLSDQETPAFDALKKVKTPNGFDMLHILQEAEEKAKVMERALKAEPKPKPAVSDGAAVVIPSIPGISSQRTHS